MNDFYVPRVTVWVSAITISLILWAMIVGALALI